MRAPEGLVDARGIHLRSLAADAPGVGLPSYDAAALIGIGLIVAGVVALNGFSKTVVH